MNHPNLPLFLIACWPTCCVVSFASYCCTWGASSHLHWCTQHQLGFHTIGLGFTIMDCVAVRLIVNPVRTSASLEWVSDEVKFLKLADFLTSMHALLGIKTPFIHCLWAWAEVYVSTLGLLVWVDSCLVICLFSYFCFFSPLSKQGVYFVSVNLSCVFYLNYNPGLNYSGIFCEDFNLYLCVICYLYICYVYICVLMIMCYHYVIAQSCQNNTYW